MTQVNFERFDGIDHIPLKVFNRVVLMTNLFADFGQTAAGEYAAMFTPEERQQMLIMQMYIKSNGVDAARKSATATLEVVYDASKDD